MSITKISAETEANILAAIDSAMTDVAGGAHPNAAIAKAASAGDFMPGHVRLMAQAYNTGRTNAQRQSASNVLEKAAEFPVADPAVILEKLYPKQVKTAAAIVRESVVSPDYTRPPAIRADSRSFFEPEQTTLVEKRAYALPPPSEPPTPRLREESRHVKKAWALLKSVQREVDEKRRLVSATRDKIASHLQALDVYFRTSGSVDYSQALKTATAALGRPAAAVLEKVAALNHRLLKQPEVKTAGCFLPTQEPYQTIQACLTAVAEHGQRSRELADYEKAAALPTQQLVGRLVKTPYDGLIFSSVMKKEGLLKVAGPGSILNDSFRNATTMSMTRKIMGSMPGGAADEDDVREKALASITDPVHEQRLRAIQAKAMLSDFMANDEVISGHSQEPHKVVDLFNQISQLAPRAAQEPMLMRALLRRHLQGPVDLHEADQLSGVEDKLRSRDQPMQIPELGPDMAIKKMLGTDKPKPPEPLPGPAGPRGPAGKPGKAAKPPE